MSLRNHIDYHNSKMDFEENGIKVEEDIMFN